MRITHPCLLDVRLDNRRRSRRGHGSAVEGGPSLLVAQTASYDRPQHRPISWWWLSGGSFVPPVLPLAALTDCRLWCTQLEAPHEFIAVGKLIRFSSVSRGGLRLRSPVLPRIDAKTLLRLDSSAQHSARNQHVQTLAPTQLKASAHFQCGEGKNLKFKITEFFL